MKIFKSILLIAALVTFTACGGSNSTTAAAVNPYATPYADNYPVGTQTGYNTFSVPGGTKTLIPVLAGMVSSSGTKVYSISQTVSAYDQILVNAAGSWVYANGTILGGISQASSDGPLSGLKISVDGKLLGSSLTATYAVPAAGTLSIEAVVSLLNLAKMSKTTYTTNFVAGYGYNPSGINIPAGVYIAHCLNTAGAAMACPAGY